MNPDEKAGRGGRAELLLYFLPVAAVALTIFVGLKYFQRGEKVSRVSAVKQARRVQQRASINARSPGAVRRRGRPGSLSISEPPLPGAPRPSNFAAAIEAASPTRASAPRANFLGRRGVVFESGAPGGAALSFVRSGGTAKRSESLRRDEARGEAKTSGKGRRADEGGRSAYAGTAGGAGKYGSGGATDPDSGNREDAWERLSTGGSSGALGALAAARGLSVNEALEGGSVEEPGDPVTNAVLGQIDVEHSMIKSLRDKAEEIRSEGRPATRGELREEAAAMMSLRGLEEGDVDPGELVERSLAPGPLVDVEVKKARTLEIMSDPATIPTKNEEKAILDRAENPPPKPSGPPPKGVVDAYQRYRATFERVEQQFGVKPEHILAILWIETRLGRVTGDHSLMKTLRTFAKGPEKHWRTKQARRDLAVVEELEGRGIIENPAALDCSWATACGTPQCMMSSCNAYWPSGGKGVFDFDASIEFVAKYLKDHDYDKSVAKSFYGYNHSQEYVAKVTAASNRIEAALKKKP